MTRNYLSRCLAIAQCGCSALLTLLLCCTPAYAEDVMTDIPDVTFTIPVEFDENSGLNTSDNARTPSSLYTHPQYSNDILKSIFADFTGKGPITYNLSVVEDLKDADGMDYFPYWLLGDAVSGGDIDLIFRPSYISDHGVYLNRVIIRNAQNRFSKEDLNVTVNGTTKPLRYTPHPSNISSDDDFSVPSQDLIYDYDSSPVEHISISTVGHGLGFSKIELYIGAGSSSGIESVTDNTMSHASDIKYYHLDGTPASPDDEGLIIVVQPDNKSYIIHQ